MLSRVADSIFWMSRYIERADNVARFIDVNYHLTLDLGDETAEQWGPLVNTTGDEARFRARFGKPTREKVLQFLTFDEENPNSILSCLRGARENARMCRESISSDMWREINKIYLSINDAFRSEQTLELMLDRPYEFYGWIKTACHVLLGVTDATMSRGEPWHFSRIGMLIERADKTSRMLDVKYYILLPGAGDVGGPLDVVQWSALLKSVGALEMYRRSRGRIGPVNVADFLLLDRHFPRSIRFCLDRAGRSLSAITGTEGDTFSNRAEQQLGRLRSQLDYTHIDDIIDRGLHEFIDELQRRLNEIGDAVYDSFFALDASAPAQFQSQSQSFRSH